VARNIGWGRTYESYGETPGLVSRMARAAIVGLQGFDLSHPLAVAACAKHFAGYGFGEAGRDYNVADISEQTLRNVVLPPFRAAVEAGAATLMNSFNEIGGIPATANAHILRDILKGEWGFNGFVVSDWQSIKELIPHGVAGDLNGAARLAITAGSDMDMEASAYSGHLAALVRGGQVSEALVDDAVRRVLRVKFAVGLFDDPFRRCDPQREKAVAGNPRFQESARAVARKSIVLLKNAGPLLPLAPTTKRIAVIGPLAADKDVPLGGWRGQAAPQSAVSLLEGIRAAVDPTTKVEYVVGAKLTTGPREFAFEPVFNTTDRSGFAAAVAAAKRADVVVIALGEDAVQTGEGRSQADIGLKGLQEELLQAVAAANPRVVLVLMNGRPLTIPWAADHIQAIVETWFLGSQAGHAIADVLFGGFNPSGRLPISFPRQLGQVPIYYNHKPTGRPLDPEGKVFWSHYMDVSNDPQFPFGFGLSYTTFAYSDLRLGARELTEGGTLTVAVTVKNTGPRAGTETVQLYVRDLVGSVTRPVKELKGFRQIELQPGEAREVTFALRTADLAYFTGRGVWEAEPGDFQVSVGSNSRDLQSAEFTLRK
jgi:beta-glucosidase